MRQAVFLGLSLIFVGVLLIVDKYISAKFDYEIFNHYAIVWIFAGIYFGRAFYKIADRYAEKRENKNK